MLELGQDEIAKYPFLADAGQYLKDKGFTLEQFGADPDLKQLLDKAFNRIQIAADGKIYKSDIAGDRVANDATLPREVFSFLLAIVLLKLSGMHTLIKRFALAEARRAEKYLEKDLA
ncbi:MAG: DNA primase, partial [Nitrosopumilus sp.]